MMQNANPFPPAWIAVDWGTTSLRVWAMGAGGAVLAAAASDQGMGSLAPEAFEPALLALIGPWLAGAGAPVPAIACGMVGARQGWREAAYRAVPCTPLGGPLLAVTPHDPRFRLHIVAGLSQADPADVMRGEEVQIAGYLAANPGFEGTLCLPGTHSKWATIRAGRVSGFQTYMTGELFALLATASVLRHALGGAGWDDAAFLAASAEALAAPETLSARLFAIRAASLLAGQSPAVARARLSGLLIGAELAATRPLWQGRAVAIIGAGQLAAHYAAALAAQGCAASRADASEVTLRGLTEAYAILRQEKPA